MRAESNKSDSLVAVLAQTAALAVAAWIVWTRAPGLQLNLSILVEALLYVMIAWGFSAFLTLTVRALAWDGAHGPVFRSSAAGIWFAPAAILLASFSPAWMFASLALVMNTTRLLVAQWVPEGPPSQPHKAWAFAVVIVLQCGIVAVMWNRPFSGAALVAVSVAILTALAIVAGAVESRRPETSPSPIMGGVVTFLLAMLLAAGSIGVSAPGGGVFPFTRTLLGRSQSTSGERPVNLTRLYEPTNEKGVVGRGGFPGVILRPERVGEKKLVVQAPSAEGLYGTLLREPVRIAFTGEYWMFQPPLRRPPERGSILERGDPFRLSFRSNNRWKLEMEAYQKLRQAVDLGCCSRLDLEILNRDPAGSADLELLVGDSASGRWQSLGIVTLAYNFPHYRERLGFAVPGNASLRQFDEIKVVFHRQVFALRSSHVSIEGTVLVPR